MKPIIGQEIADRHRRPKWPPAPGARQACPVCGHPTGDCTSPQTQDLAAEETKDDGGQAPGTP